MFNLVVLTGRCVQSPELKTTPNGISVTSFSIAVNRKYQSGEEPQTDFINIVAWRSTAEFVTRYFTKGKMIGIEGSIQTRNYTDKNGNKRTAFEVVANNVQFVESNREQNNPNNNVEIEVAPENDPLPEFANKLNELNEFGEIGEAYQDDLPF